MSVIATELTQPVMFDYPDLDSLTAVFAYLAAGVSRQPLIRFE